MPLSSASPPTDPQRDAILALNARAAAYFRAALGDERGGAARAFCAERGISDAAIARFGLGFAPDAWRGLTLTLQRAHCDVDLAVAAGLLKRNAHGYYDVYRNRLIVPIRALDGRIVAFGGRTLESEGAKYINTSTTPAYTKGDYLFGLDIARQSDRRQPLIVVEGYLDCVALHQYRFDNTVATLGTALTAAQAALLRNTNRSLVLCFDGDLAGRRAALKAIETLGGAIEHVGTAARVVSLPEGVDPDTFVARAGAPAFAQLVEYAPPAIAILIADLTAAKHELGRTVRAIDTAIRTSTAPDDWDRWRLWCASQLPLPSDRLPAYGPFAP